MKLIDFDGKIAEVKGGLVDSVPKLEAPKKVETNEVKLKLVLKVISNELLKDPVIVSLMAFRNSPSPASMKAFLATVKTYVDYATAVRYREMLKDIFVEKEVKNDQTV